jgi:hypothetical protein
MYVVMDRLSEQTVARDGNIIPKSQYTAEDEGQHNKLTQKAAQ